MLLIASGLNVNDDVAAKLLAATTINQNKNAKIVQTGRGTNDKIQMLQLRQS